MLSKLVDCDIPYTKLHLFIHFVNNFLVYYTIVTNFIKLIKGNIYCTHQK